MRRAVVPATRANRLAALISNYAMKPNQAEMVSHGLALRGKIVLTQQFPARRRN
jgi:hypothetical protein